MAVDHQHGLASDVQQALLEADWPHLLKKGLVYTATRIFHFGGMWFLKARRDEYVQEAAKLILEGQRQFDPERQTLFQCLAGVIDSLISHDIEKVVRRGYHFSLVQGPDDDLLPGEISEEQLAGLDDFENEVLLRDQRDKFIASIDDEELRRYAQMRADGAYDNAEEFAKALQTTVENIRNMDRRLRRRRAQWSNRTF